MKKYKPNFIPLKIRVWSTVGAVYLLFFTVAVLAMGHVYLPTKQGGLLLSGFPTIMVSVGSIALCVAAVLTVVDHYDKRPNEHKYKTTKVLCYKVTAFMYVGAPIIEIIERILLYKGIDLFPDFHGFAEKYTFYTPGLSQYGHYVDVLVKYDGWVILAFIIFAGLGVGINKYFPGVSKRVVALMVGFGMLCLSYSVLLFAINDFLLGEVEGDDAVYRVTDEPAKFNAVLFTSFVWGVVMFMASITVIVGLVFNRIKVQEVKF